MRGPDRDQFHLAVREDRVQGEAAVGRRLPGGHIKLYRLYNDGMSGAPNHRYTTSLTVRSQMIAAGWTPEDPNTACVPY